MTKNPEADRYFLTPGGNILKKEEKYYEGLDEQGNKKYQVYVEYNLMSKEQMAQIRELMEHEGTHLGPPGEHGREFSLQSLTRLQQNGPSEDCWERYDQERVAAYLQRVAEVADGDKATPEFTKEFPPSYQRPVIENHRRLMPKTAAYRDRFVQKYDDRPHLGRHFKLKSTKIDDKKALYQNFADLRALNSNSAEPRKLLSSGNMMGGGLRSEGLRNQGQEEMENNKNPNRITRRVY